MVGAGTAALEKKVCAVSSKLNFVSFILLEGLDASEKVQDSAGSIISPVDYF